MALKDLLFKKTKTEALQGEPGVVYTPIKGKVISLKEIADGVFSEGILGDGCGIEPSEEVVSGMCPICWKNRTGCRYRSCDWYYEQRWHGASDSCGNGYR